MHRPRPARSSTPTPGTAGGFSLIELLAVIALLAMVVLIVSSAPTPGRFRGEGMVALRQIAAGLREARSRAIAENREVVFALDVEGRRYRIGSGPADALPAGIDLVLDTVREEQIGATSGGIRFFPDGSSSGGRIILERGPRRESIAVHWLTGRIVIDDR
jgi:general secretion pathway protein H